MVSPCYHLSNSFKGWTASGDCLSKVAIYTSTRLRAAPVNTNEELDKCRITKVFTYSPKVIYYIGFAWQSLRRGTGVASVRSC